MNIENRNGEANISFIVSDIHGDMGEDDTLTLIQQADGDVCLCFTLHRGSYKDLRSIEFCTSNGGGRYPVIANKLRELISELVKEQGKA